MLHKKSAQDQMYLVTTVYLFPHASISNYFALTLPAFWNQNRKRNFLPKRNRNAFRIRIQQKMEYKSKKNQKSKMRDNLEKHCLF